MTLSEKYIIKRISYQQAIDVIVKRHYLHRKAPCTFAFGLYERNGEHGGLFTTDRLAGVICYGTPSSAPLRKGVCGPEEANNVIELTRLWVEDGTPKNTESFLIGNTIPLVDKEIIVSFAEIEAGHVGTVYQATNWIYTGLSAKRMNWRIRGCDLHSQTIGDKYTSKEIREKYGDNFYTEQRARKHRYVFFNCNRRRKKQLLAKLRYPVQSYPKQQISKIA